MENAQPSRTAMVTAVGRALHRMDHAQPWVLDDPYGPLLVGPDWVAIRDQFRQAVPPHVLDEASAGVAVRTRYGEDRLSAGIGQYVLLGAGLDSFAWRRPDLMRDLTLFEVDHPSSQTWKLQRVDALGLPRQDGHHFVSVDFENDDLIGRLTAAGWRDDVPTLFTWIGVTFYLTTESIAATLSAVAGAAARGSELLMSYAPPDHLLDEVGLVFTGLMSAVAAGSGEPVITRLTPDDAQGLMTQAGFAVVDHPTRDDLTRRYFPGRPDGLRPGTFERFVVGRLTTSA